MSAGAAAVGTAAPLLLFLLLLSGGAVAQLPLNVIQLYDGDFEHATQAATGQTTGRWCVLLAPGAGRGTPLAEAWAALAADEEKTVIYATVRPLPTPRGAACRGRCLRRCPQPARSAARSPRHTRAHGSARLRAAQHRALLSAKPRAQVDTDASLAVRQRFGVEPAAPAALLFQQRAMFTAPAAALAAGGEEPSAAVIAAAVAEWVASAHEAQPREAVPQEGSGRPAAAVLPPGATTGSPLPHAPKLAVAAVALMVVGALVVVRRGRPAAAAARPKAQ